jgi:hypothetical protein
VNEYPIDDVHRLIAGLDTLLVRLRSDGPTKIAVERLPELIETIHELDGWRNTTYLQTKVGINGSLLNQFMKLRGSVNRHDAIKIADRLRGYLRAQDQAFGNYAGEVVAEPPSTSMPAETEQGGTVAPLRIKSESWVTIIPSRDVAMKIAAISSLLDTILVQIKNSNAPPDNQILTELERKQLISILETALNLLRSPMVETGFLKKTSEALKKGAQSAIEKQTQ